jgi:flagellar motor switch protein FliG
MCTKWFSDGAVHKYFNPYGSPYDAYINYMNVLADFQQRLLSGSEKGDYPVLKQLTKEVRQAIEEQGEIISSSAKKIREKAGKKLQDVKTGEGGLDDILKLSNTRIKELIRQVDISELTAALQESTDEVKEKVLVNLPKRALKKYDEMSSQVRRWKKSDIKKYREKVEKELKKLILR